MLARRYDIGLNIDAEEADRLEISLDLLEALCFDPELAGWNGIGFVVQAYQKRAPVRDRLADRPGAPQRPPADGAAGQGRLLGHRDQARAGRRARGLSGVHAQGAHRRLLPRLRAQAARRARRGLSAIRHPQRAHARGHLSSWPAQTSTPASTSSSACTAWASRCTRRWSGRDKLEPPVPHLRAGRHARDAARLSRAPAAGERRQHLVRQPHRRSERAGRRAGRRSGRRGAAAITPLGAPHPKIALPRDLLRRERAQFRRPRSHQRAAPGVARRGAAGERRHGRGTPRRCWRRSRGAARARCAIRPTGATSSGMSSRPTTRRSTPRSPPPRATARVWQATPPDAARRLPAARRRPAGSAAPALIGLIVREAGQVRCRTRSARCARRSTSCATTRRRCAIDFADRHASPARARSSASARGISRWRSSSARSRRRWRPAIRCWRSRPSETPLIAAQAVRLLHEAGVPAAALQLLPGDGAVGARLVADRARARRDVHRLDRGRAADRASPRRRGSIPTAGRSR